MTTSNTSESVRALLGEIQRAFNFWNDRYYSGALPMPVFNFHPQPRNGKRLGHYCPSAWRDGEERRDEIVFYADLCLEMGMRQVVLTLVHEMAHLAIQESARRRAEATGAVCKTPKGHGQAWTSEANRLGLHVEGRLGITTETPQFAQDIEAFAPRTDAIPFRQGAAAGLRQKGKMRKFSCPCGINVRVGREEFSATCNLCGSPFVAADARTPVSDNDDNGGE